MRDESIQQLNSGRPSGPSFFFVCFRVLLKGFLQILPIFLFIFWVRCLFCRFLFHFSFRFDVLGKKSQQKIRPPGGWHGSAEGDQRVSWLKGLMDGFIPNFHSYFGDVSFAAMKPNFHSYFMLFWDKTIPC